MANVDQSVPVPDFTSGPFSGTDGKLNEDCHLEKGDIPREVVLSHETALIGLSPWQAATKLWRPSMYVILCAFGVLADGYQAAMPGAVLASPGFIEQFGTIITPDGTRALAANIISGWGATALSFQVLGNVSGGLLSDRFGRKVAMYILTVFFAIGNMIEILARNWSTWLAAKIFTGAAQGMVQSTLLTYMSEIAPSQIRGSLLLTYGWAFAIGQLLVNIVNHIISTTVPTAYRRSLYSQWAIWGVWVCIIPFLPESPWYLCRKQQNDKAKAVLRRLYKGVANYNAERELDVMLLELDSENAARDADSEVSWLDIFRGTNLVGDMNLTPWWIEVIAECFQKRTLAACTGIYTQSWAGATVVFNYTTYFFQQAGIPEPFTSSVYVSTILIGSLLVASYVVEKAGRRILIVYGGFIAGLFNVLIGTMGLLDQTDSVKSAALALICIWVANYAFAFAGVGWAAVSEIATPRLRAKTAAFAAATASCGVIVYDVATPKMLAAKSAGGQGWGLKTVYMYAVLSIVGACINFFVFPETKGRSFNEIDEMFEAGISPRHMRTYVSQVEQTGQKRH